MAKRLDERTRQPLIREVMGAGIESPTEGDILERAAINGLIDPPPEPEGYEPQGAEYFDGYSPEEIEEELRKRGVPSDDDDYSSEDIDAELQSRGVGKPQSAQQASMSPLGYIKGAAEVAGTMASGAIAEPVSGLAGYAKLLTEGPEQAKKSIEEVQQALTYMPKTPEGQAMAQSIGRLIKPVADFLGKIPEAAGELAMKAGGPAAGATASTMVQIIPEILGLKGAKSAKKLALKRILKDADVAQVFDSAGNVRREIRAAARNADIDIDTAIKESGMREQAKRISKMPSEKIAADVRPNQEIIDAAEEFGVSENMLASHVSENPTFRAVEQGLKSIPGSTLAAREKALISDLSKRADDLIIEFGGEIDKSALSDSYRFKAERVISDLEDRASDLYEKVDSAIPRETLVEPNSTLELLSELAGELGGEKYLSPKERLLFKNLSPESKPTYARLDRVRKEIGQAIGKGSGPFKDSESGLLKRIYRAISEDQADIAEQFGMRDTYNVAKDLVSTRKGIESQLQKSLGKQLTGMITTKAKNAMLGLQKGETSQFDELVSNIPDHFGADTKKSIISTALNDAFVQGSRKEKSLNIPGFDDFMNGLGRNKAAKKRLVDEIGQPAMKRLDSFHTLIRGIRRAQEDAITTGRVMSVPKMFDEQTGLAAKLYGITKTIIPEVITTAGGAPGVGTAMRVSMPKVKKAARSLAADELLASEKFRSQVKNMATGNLTEEHINAAIKTIPAYKRWTKALTESEAAELASLGFVEYLRNEE